MTAEEIQRNLVTFARRWSLYDGTERAEAQTFLNELFACYGTDRHDVGAGFETLHAGGFLDLLWPRVCLIEMKRPSEAGRLERHRPQAFDYWRKAADPHRNLPAPQFVVLCAFHSFEIWEPGGFPQEPRAEFNLIDLPDRLDALMFLAGREPVFVGSQEAVTRDAVRLITGLFRGLGDRRAAPVDELRDFMLQCVWCMFAEDLGQIEGYLFTRLVDDLIGSSQRSSADDLGLLFEWLSRDDPRPAAGLYAQTPYANGGLFEHPSRVHLEREELLVLALACEYDWRRVEPHIFGSLLEGTLGHEAQWELGAHYTHEVDIQKVIRPSIVEPWQERIENATSLTQITGLQHDLLNYVVLDPACGSGNFLYIAYRELRRLEARLRERERELRIAGGVGRHRIADEQRALSAFFPLNNIRGIEISSFAVSLARVTLWMGHRLAVEELDLPERTLPLEDLSGIQVGDALRTEWPPASVIVGNPPFHGDRHLRSLLGDDYVEWLQQAFDCGVRDHCVYWFRKAHDHLDRNQRAGLVGTNSISQNRGREASLNYIVERDGVLVDAVSTQQWPGEANVDVSIVNWIKAPDSAPTRFVIDNQPVEGIDTALDESTIPIADVPVLRANLGRAYQGFLPGAPFDISRDAGLDLLRRDDARYSDVVKLYLDGRDITRTINQTPSRYTIDFGQIPLEAALRYPAALEVVRRQAKTAREESTSYHRNPKWWQFLWPRPEFRAAVHGLPRFIAGTATAKRIYFIWCASDWRPSNSTNMFAFADDYAMGVLSSTVHTEWASKKSSTLQSRIRYTPSSAFETFPWPQPSNQQREAISDLSRQLLAHRGTLCEEHERGLNRLYNALEEGAFDSLRRLHEELDRAVIRAYGWDEDLAHDIRERNERLYDLNKAIVTGPSHAYKPF